MTAYDKILYPSYSHPQTHPDNLAVIGMLFGLSPTPVTGCRVLELGCGDGSNLVPMAWGLPGSEFVGVDLAEVPVRAGQKMAGELGLSNVRLIHGNVMEIDRSWGEFDYILAHGLYSWVPTEVRDRVMAVCRLLLKPQGIAFISYNALPGAHLRLMLREMMLFHVRQAPSPEERLEQARALLSFLAMGQVKADDEYAVWLHKELERGLNLDRSHLFHDDLAGVNQPVYFHQFMAHATQHELQFLGEADFFEMSDHIFAPSIREALQGTARDRVLREQYLDFLKCRRFRQTLLCRNDAKLNPEPDSSVLTRLFVSSKAKKQKPEAPSKADVPGKEAAPTVYRTLKGAAVETDYPAGRAILQILEEIAPARMAFADLLSGAKARLAGEEVDVGAVCGFLFRLFSAGVIECKTSKGAATRTVGEFPKSSPLARWQIEQSSTVTSLDHQMLEVEDEVGKQLIRYLDGTRNRAQLTNELMQFLKSRGALGEGTEEEIRAKVAKDLEGNLVKLGNLALLTA